MPLTFLKVYIMTGKAIVRFHYGRTIYEIGDVVPEEVIKKYPHLVGLIFDKQPFEKEKKEFTSEPVKSEGMVLSTKKKTK